MNLVLMFFYKQDSQRRDTFVLGCKYSYTVYMARPCLLACRSDENTHLTWTGYPDSF